MKKYTIEKLLNDALDTSSAEYQTILDAFDGVKASSECEQLFYYVVHDYIASYNAAADDWDMIPADLNTSKKQVMIKKAIMAIIRSSICTTKTGARYYRFDDWPTHDEDLKEMPAMKKLIS